MDYIGGFHFTLGRYQSKHHLSLLVFLAFNLLFMNEPTCTTQNAHLFEIELFVLFGFVTV